MPSRPLLVALVLLVGAVPARADKCTGNKLKDIGKEEAAILACHATAAAKGDSSLLDACIQKARAKFGKTFAKAGSCAGDQSVCECLVDNCVASVLGVLPDPGKSKCKAVRLTAARKRALGELKCNGKAAKKGIDVDADCLQKVEASYAKVFAKTSGCSGDAATVQSTVDGVCVAAVGPQVAGGVSGAICGSCTPIAALTNRDRLLASYLAFLNTIGGSTVHTTCELWAALDPSAQATFLTITARLDGSLLADDTTVLDHVTKLYRVAGGQNASAGDPGSCGGGEYNRLMMSVDQQLHDALVAANVNQGGNGAAGRPDVLDIPAGGFWRDSQDLGGVHAPFDMSDETNDGAPRGQVQFFADPASTLANTALGRLGVETVVDPYALEVSHAYDCIHNANPLCSYTTYGALCVPQASMLGTAIYTANYGDFGATWLPAGCQ